MAELSRGIGSFVVYAIMNAAERIEADTIGNMYVDSSRQNLKRPATIVLSVDDEWVKNLVGFSAQQDAYVMLRIPRDVYLEYHELSKEKPLIVPSGIVNIDGELISSEQKPQEVNSD